MSCIGFCLVSAQMICLADFLTDLTLYQVLSLGPSHSSSRVVPVFDVAVEAKDAQSVAEGALPVAMIEGLVFHIGTYLVLNYGVSWGATGL
jgi:hypothetical protein